MRWNSVDVAEITCDEDRTGWVLAWLAVMAAVLCMVVTRGARAEPMTGPQSLEHVEAEIVAQTTAVQLGETFTAGLRLKMDEHWHTYWINPGDSGMATSISWDVPEGVEVGPILWPAPQYFVVGGLASFAYEGEIVLPVRIAIPETLSGDELTLKATADWLVCDDICIPGSAELALVLPIVEHEPEVDTRWVELFKKSSQRTPTRLDESQAMAYQEDDGIVLEVASACGGADEASPQTFSKDARFFPYEGSGLLLTEPQVITVDAEAGSIRIALTPSPTHRGPIERLRGVVVFNDTQSASQPSAFEVDLAVHASQTP